MFLRRELHFDYTQLEPSAAVRLGSVGIRGRVVPVGHTTTVCLELLMPESDYNRHIGMFQKVGLRVKLKFLNKYNSNIVNVPALGISVHHSVTCATFGSLDNQGGDLGEPATLCLIS